MKNITSIVEEINKDGQMTKERVNAIISSFFEADDVNNSDMTKEEYEANRIYYKEVNGFDCDVTKWDETLEDGFDLMFAVCCGSDDDMVKTVHIESIADLYGAVAIIANFDQDPFDTVANLNNYGVTDLDTFFENVCKIDDGFFFDVEGKRIWVAKTTETSKHGDNVVEHNSLQAFALDEDGELIDNDLDGADLEFVNYKCDDDELANAYTTILNAARRLAE